MQRKSKTTIAGALGLALALIGQSPASATIPPMESGWSLSSSVQTSTQLISLTTVQPLVGDFNGDGRSDVLFYAPGAGADYLWTSKPYDEANPTSRFSVKTLRVNGTYTPFVGDFDGNGASDIFWYAAGTPADSIWYYANGVVVRNAPYSVLGQYTPVVANFDSTDTDDLNQKDDIFFYSSGGTSSLWSGKTNRTFSSRSYTTGPPANAKALVGNWIRDPELTDGTYNVDLLFYGPGSGADALWAGDGTGAFTSMTKTISGSYIPVVGNFDLPDETPAPGTTPVAGMTDILWYGPGTGPDSVWMNNGTSFSTHALSVSGAGYKPFVIPGILGGDTIMWNNPTGADSVWGTRGRTSFEYVPLPWPAADMGTRTPLVGMFDDDLTVLQQLGGPYGADVLWAQAGNTTAQKEVLWAGDDAGKWVLQEPVNPVV